MRTFIISGSINEELLKNFNDFANQHENDEWNVIIESNGGSANIASIIAFMLNTKGEDCTLLASKINSSAFTIFIKSNKCKRKIVLGATGMIHLSYTSVDLDTRGKVVWACDKNVVKNMKQIHYRDDVKDMEGLLSKKKMKKFLKGNDIWFTSDDLIKMFPDCELV